MTPEDKKAVTLWLGENRNRTFTTWSDFGRCFERLMETGQRLKFMDFMRFLHQGRSIVVDETTWLLSKETDGTFRLCNLIAEALKKGVLK